MNARISRLSILSEDNYTLGRFYEGLFHMRPTVMNGATDAVRVSDGNIELEIRPRLPGYRAQLDDFNLEVDDVQAALARIHENYPTIEMIERSGSCAVAAAHTHDPDGNVFSLTQVGAKDRDGTDVKGDRKPVRIINHVALRVLHPKRVADFYVKVFGLVPVAGAVQGNNIYLSDGHVTLVIIPWCINDFEGTGITARGMDHIGFQVESIAALKSDIHKVTEKNYRFQPSTSILGKGKEGAGRLAMFQRTCPLGCYHMADSDGLLLDVTE